MCKKTICYILLLSLVLNHSIGVASNLPAVQENNFPATSGYSTVGWGGLLRYFMSAASRQNTMPDPNCNHNWVHDGLFNWDKCSICGGSRMIYNLQCIYNNSSPFDDNVTDTELQNSYQDYVDTLPVTTLSSDGRLIWNVCYDDLDFSHIQKIYPCTGKFDYMQFDGNSKGYEYTEDGYIKSARFISENEIEIYYYRELKNNLRMGIDIYFIAPIDGDYNYISSEQSSVTYDNGELTNFTEYYDSWSKTYYFDKGYVFHYTTADWSRCSDGRRVYGIVRLPSLTIIPKQQIDVNTENDSETYNINTRVTNISGNFGTYDSSTQTIKQIDSHNIVNETDNSVYNPITNETYDMSSWTYDYSTRTYNVTYNITNEGDTSTTETKNLSITYGDENITVTDDDNNSETIYYLVPTSDNESGGDDSGSGSGSGSDGSGSSDDTPVVVVPDSLLIRLQALRDGLVEFFTSLPAMFENLTAFYAEAFPWIPEEITGLIGFSVAIGVLVGIYKLFWR